MSTLVPLLPRWRTGKVVKGGKGVKPCSPRVRHISDLKGDTPVTALPGVWHCGVSAGTDRLALWVSAGTDVGSVLGQTGIVGKCWD